MILENAEPRDTNTFLLSGDLNSRTRKKNEKRNAEVTWDNKRLI